MKVGAEDKKKLALAIGLSLIAAGTVYVQFFSGEAAPTPPIPRPAPPATAQQPRAQAARQQQAPRPASRRPRTAVRGGEFEPVWRNFAEEEGFDPIEADPTLRTDLLAAVRNVDFNGVDRNIFEFGPLRPATPPPSAEDAGRAQRLQQAFADANRPSAPPPPSKPAMPRLDWKYFGYAAAPETSRRAFLLDGDDVLIAAEGDVLRNRYEVKRIGLTAIVIQDLEFDEEQSLPITVPQS